MIDDTPQPLKTKRPPSREPASGGHKGHWKCYESLMLRLHAVFSTALILLIFAGDVIQNQDLKAAFTAHGENYAFCWAVMNALAASALKYRDNSQKQI